VVSTATDKTPSLAQQAYQTIKQQIIELQLPPGRRLVERDLAADLKISRIPLREALQLLEAEGLVVSVPRRGTMVAPFSTADVRHLFDVRESLEVLAARLAAQRGDADGLRRAQQQLRTARQAIQAGDDAAAAAANADFHQTIIDMSGNPLLQAMMQPLAARVNWLFHLTHERNIAEQCADHEQLYIAIAAGDAEQAGRLAFDHVRSGREPSLALAATWAVPDHDPIEITRTRQRTRPATRTSRT
jgi:DNA-binding GntR family transcriptional regulator